jgi:hypothetical protein
MQDSKTQLAVCHAGSSPSGSSNSDWSNSEQNKYPSVPSVPPANPPASSLSWAATDKTASTLPVNKVVVNDALGDRTGTAQSSGRGANTELIAPLVISLVCAVGLSAGVVLYFFRYRKSSDEEPRVGIL